MINFKDFYTTVRNPLEDAGILDKIISFYTVPERLYTKIVSTNVSEKTYSVVYSKANQDELYKNLFAIWKDKVLSFDSNWIDNSIKKKLVENDFYTLQEILRKIPTIGGYDEFFELLEKYEYLFKKYGFSGVGKGKTWQHISSKELMLSDNDIDIEHRLYMNTDSIDTERLVLLFINKCREKNLPFNFKYTENPRDDAFVIYSDTVNLEKYLFLLEELNQENREFFKRLNPPMILAGYITNWLGYGSETITLGKSFSSKRCDVIDRAMKRAINYWIHKNKDAVLGEENLPLAKVLTEKIIKDIFEEESAKKDRYYRMGQDYRYYEMTGLSQEDFLNGKVEKMIRYSVSAYMSQLILYRYSEKVWCKAIRIPTRNKNFISVVVDEVFEKQYPWIVRYAREDSSFKELVKLYIIDEGIKQGIDKNNFAFDVWTKNIMLSYYNRQLQEIGKMGTAIRDKEKQQRDEEVIDRESIRELIEDALANTETTAVENRDFTNIGYYDVIDIQDSLEDAVTEDRVKESKVLKGEIPRLGDGFDVDLEEFKKNIPTTVNVTARLGEENE